MGIFSFVKPGKQIFKTITSVKPNVGKSKLKKAVDSAKLEGLKLKGKTKKFIQKMEQASICLCLKARALKAQFSTQ